MLHVLARWATFWPHWRQMSCIPFTKCTSAECLLILSGLTKLFLQNTKSSFRIRTTRLKFFRGEVVALHLFAWTRFSLTVFRFFTVFASTCLLSVPFEQASYDTPQYAMGSMHPLDRLRVSAVPSIATTVTIIFLYKQKKTNQWE